MGREVLDKVFSSERNLINDFCGLGAVKHIQKLFWRWTKSRIQHVIIETIFKLYLHQFHQFRDRLFCRFAFTNDIKIKAVREKDVLFFVFYDKGVEIFINVYFFSMRLLSI